MKRTILTATMLVMAGFTATVGAQSGGKAGSAETKPDPLTRTAEKAIPNLEVIRKQSEERQRQWDEYDKLTKPSPRPSQSPSPSPAPAPSPKRN
jgi:hypothetical protein